jgi:hypothetical protein
MIKRHFANHELYTLRNDIPIDALIEKALCIPSRVAEGHFRFLCPLCKQFNTAVNPETNLARCFRCEENFNTIDLVILIRKSDFVESVRFLQEYHKKSVSVSQRDDYRKATTGSATHKGAQMKNVDRSENLNNSPVHIRNILDQVTALKCDETSGSHSVDQTKSIPVQQNMLNDRILKLEKKVDYMGHQIKNILKAIHLDNPSHQ